jgi:hypothetical protein
MADGGWWVPLLDLNDTLLGFAKTGKKQSFLRQVTLSQVLLR